MGRLRRRTVSLALAGLLGLALHAAAAFAGPNLFVGADEDNVLWGNSQQTGSIARTLGLKAIHITVPWHPGQTAVPPTYEAQLDRATVDAWGLRLVVSVYGRADEAPQTDEARSEYCAFVADLLKQHPTINDVVVWNDPNDAAFWSPQYDSAGSSLAPAAYEALLARCWDVLHAARSGVNIVALSASSKGALSLGSHAPGTWWREVGAAYHEGGRTEPIFDTVGHIPHPENSAERPWTKHGTAGPIGEGDYDALMGALSDAFTGTAQPLPGQGPMTIWYLVDGFQTAPDPAKASLYTGNESDPAPVPAWSATESSDSREGPAPDQAVQLADALAVAYCQPAVGAFFNFHLADESDLAGWQSGVFWADWTPKPSYWSLKHELGLLRTQAIDCSTFSKTGAPPAPAPTPPPGPALQISALRVASVSAFAATIDWKTSVPTASRVAFGLPGSGPTVWAGSTTPTLDHEVTLPGLSYSTGYRVWITATADDGQRAQTALDVWTTGLPHSPNATVARTGGGVLLLDGQPFFPELVWAQCPGGYGADLAAGINLFASNPCGGLQQQLDSLGGRGLSAAVTNEPGGSGPGMIGFFWPDEADGLGMTAADLSAPLSGVSFLTLTNHFYSGAAPLPFGRAMYPGLIAKSDVVGFDLYPLQEWCKPDRMVDVYLSQRELVKLSAPRPTFQWIEVSSWNANCPHQVTPATVEAESWLAIAGGARGLGFFPATWTPTIGRAIAGVSRQISLLGPALMAPTIPSSAKSDNSLVRVAARSYKGALYVIAVNAGFSATEATIGAAGLAGRPLTVLDEGRRVAVNGSSFRDSFAPLDVHIYVAAPSEGS